MRSVEDRFWSKVAKSNECWIWIGALTEKGYGRLFADRRMRAAHRLAWEISVGAIPDGAHVLHHCDVRACVKPDHLFLGTNTENVADMVCKQRQSRGENFPQAKLSDVDVGRIKAELRRGAVQAQLARLFLVSPTTLNSIALGRKWKHVAPANDAGDPRATGTDSS